MSLRASKEKETILEEKIHHIAPKQCPKGLSLYYIDEVLF
jgi:hypothetical protein